MGKMRGSQNFIILVISLMLGWTLNSVYHVVSSPEQEQSDSHLLYQIAVFQIEMLNSAFVDIPNLKATQQLTILKQMAYAVDYTHERFLISIGENKVAELSSLKRMMDYILRLQIGGDRQLKPEEIRIFIDASVLFKQLYEEYAKLMVEDNDGIVAAVNKKIHKDDLAIYNIFSRKLLQ
ncbi:hypothetical protein EHS13_10945 [Paenibacillus psychroresistens]|uniref:S-adenosylmethionine decarboxylase n=1 Tax=Paenibacillus psychroresistens TaxID=1778678 RepID=A0A6B8RHZ4_9BACL|nr:hypothetical protein [Paenibacillus psychroresistens]QGQ95364.1 hypothetical protein EHS13_10945 [Paenibacillus psychroresistens]